MPHRVVQIGRMRVCGERMIVSHEEITMEIPLHLHRVFHHPEIVSEVQITCGANAADYRFH